MIVTVSQAQHGIILYQPVKFWAIIQSWSGGGSHYCFVPKDILKGLIFNSSTT